MLLADSAQEVGGKLYILGGGWSISGPGSPSAIAIKFDVPWDRANQQHKIELDLLTEDGEAVLIEGPEGELPIRMEGQLEVGRPPGLRPGTPIDAAMAINLGPLPLQPGRRYVWRLAVDGHHDDDWSLPFTVRATLPPAPGS